MKLILTTILLLITNIAFNQNIHELRIGEQMPDITVNNFLNDSDKKLNFSQLSGKLVILDFWNDECSSCIAAMPRLDALQKQFNDKIQIIYVTKNSREQVLKLLSRIKMSIPDMPFVVSDTLLNKLFPHSGDPLHVWINQNGNVYAITFDYNTNPRTIREFLDGKEPHLSRRRDFGINPAFPLLSEQNSNIFELAKSYSSLFTDLNEYFIPTGIYFRRDSTKGRITSISAINLPLLSLYSLAYNNEIFNYDVNFFQLARNNRIILELKDSSDFIEPKDEEKIADWMSQNVLSYEIKIPSTDTGNVFTYMQQDLARYLPYKAKIERVKIKCLVLQKTGNDSFNGITTNSGIPATIEYNADNSVEFSNVPFPAFVMQLIYDNTDINTPIIDETGILKNISIRIGCRLSDIPALKIELQKYGLTLKEKELPVDMLVITK